MPLRDLLGLLEATPAGPFHARHAVEDIQKQVAAVEFRDGNEIELPAAELVPGDVIRLQVDRAAVDLPAGHHGMADRTNR